MLLLTILKKIFHDVVGLINEELESLLFILVHDFIYEHLNEFLWVHVSKLDVIEEDRPEVSSIKLVFNGTNLALKHSD